MGFREDNYLFCLKKVNLGNSVKMVSIGAMSDAKLKYFENQGCDRLNSMWNPVVTMALQFQWFKSTIWL